MIGWACCFLKFDKITYVKLRGRISTNTCVHKVLLALIFFTHKTYFLCFLVICFYQVKPVYPPEQLFFESICQQRAEQFQTNCQSFPFAPPPAKLDQ